MVHDAVGAARRGKNGRETAAGRGKKLTKQFIVQSVIDQVGRKIVPKLLGANL